MATHEDLDSLEIATLKQNIRSLLDEKVYSSITQFHWIATILNPGFKSLSFLPDSTPANRKFKRICWKTSLDGLRHSNKPTVEQRLQSQNPLPRQKHKNHLKKKKIVFGSMRNNVQPVICIIDATLNLKQEYDMYINGGVATDYDEEDPLTYWASVQYRFPPLGRLARHFLCCTSTSAQSERDFSHTRLKTH